MFSSLNPFPYVEPNLINAFNVKLLIREKLISNYVAAAQW
jgi:hypothetical protein